MIRDSKVLNTGRFPFPLRRLGILILPGVVIILQRSVVWRYVPVLLLPVLICGVVFLISLDIRFQRELQPWHLPALGALFWEIRFLAQWFLGFHGASAVTELILGLALLMEFVIILRQRSFPVQSAWPLMAGLLLLFGFEASSIPSQWLTLFLLNVGHWCLIFLPFMIGGLLLSRRQGLDSALLIVACEPVWLEMYLAPNGISYELWSSPDPKTQLAWLGFRILPSLGFLILIPVVAFLNSRAQTRKWWLAMSSALFVGGIVLIRVAVLRDPGSSFVFSNSLMWAYFFLVLWIPVLLAVKLYSTSGEPTLVRGESA